MKNKSFIFLILLIFVFFSHSFANQSEHRDSLDLRSSSGDSCFTMERDLRINVPCVKYQGAKYSFILDFYHNIDDPFGLYWILDNASVSMSNSRQCIIDWDVSLDMSMPCVDFMGTTYGFDLLFDENLSNENNMYWVMDPESLILTRTLRVYMLTSQWGYFSALPDGDGYLVTMINTHPTAYWYTDRPGREFGEEPVSTFLNESWSRVYGDIEPNAILRFNLLRGGSSEGVFAQVRDTHFDQASGLLTLNIKPLNNSIPDGLGGHLVSNVVVGILNNMSEGGSGPQSYLLSGGRASLNALEHDEPYVLRLMDTDEQVFWMDNAPGRYSFLDHRDTFLGQWNYLFGDSDPNASIYGQTPDGRLKLYLMTISSPRVDPDSGELSFATAFLGDAPTEDLDIRQFSLFIDAASSTAFPLPGKGICYQAFGTGYDPSTANLSQILFGSDIARKEVASLWGNQSYVRESCEPYCRDDLQRMKKMGVNLIRLYDWDPRNDHSQFLNYAQSLGLKVVVAMSNYPAQHPESWDDQVPLFLNHGNFGNASNSDWHPAIAGVMVTNEPFLNNVRYENAIGLVARLLEEAGRRGYNRRVKVGIPVAFIARGAPFASNGANMPGWRQFDQFVNAPELESYRDQLMLCPNTYNDGHYLFESASENPGTGWVAQTFEQFQTPIFISEIGKSRGNSDFSQQYIHDQLEGAMSYQKTYPNQLLGVAFFQFSNKVWMQDKGDEGAFGVFRHGQVLKRMNFSPEDFRYWPGDPAQEIGTLSINELTKTDSYKPLVEVFSAH